MPAKPAISAVNHVSPVLPPRAVGDTAEDPGFRFKQLNLAQLNKGQLYQGKVMARLDDLSFLVALNGSALRMVLGKEAQIGEFIALRYMGGHPTPTFLLSPPSQSGSQTRLSPSAQLISQFLGDSGNKNPAHRLEARLAITDSALNSASRIAGDLKQALVLSGLFYESHLAEYLSGKRPLSVLLQEPQNQPAGTLTSLVPQQLQALEQQRLLWHGEVWPEQQMEWEISRHDRQDTQHDADTAMIVSRITLHLPQLGEVSANISHIDGRMRIELHADSESTLSLLKRESARLAERLQAAGQSLDHLSVQAHVQQPAHP